MNYIQQTDSFEDQVGLYFVKTDGGGDFRPCLSQALMFAHEAFGRGASVLDICRIGSCETFDWPAILHLWKMLNLNPESPGTQVYCRQKGTQAQQFG